MTVQLELGPRIGAARVAALVETRVAPKAGRRAIRGWAAKRPLAVLISEDDKVRAFDPEGRPLAPDDVERLRPGTLAAMRAEGS